VHATRIVRLSPLTRVGTHVREQEMTFWRRVVQRVVAPLVQAEPPAGSGGVAWSHYDFVGPAVPPLSS
jgi:hypothetical protein